MVERVDLADLMVRELLWAERLRLVLLEERRLRLTRRVAGWRYWRKEK